MKLVLMQKVQEKLLRYQGSEHQVLKRGLGQEQEAGQEHKSPRLLDRSGNWNSDPSRDGSVEPSGFQPSPSPASSLKQS